MTDAALRYHLLYIDLIVLQASDEFSEDDELMHAEKMDAQWDQMTFEEQQDFRRMLTAEAEPSPETLNFIDQSVAEGADTLARIPVRSAA